MLKDIIKRLAEDTGFHLEQDRAALVNLAHRSAEMLWERLECNAIYREVTVLVPENLVISLPHFVGPLRAMRESNTDQIVPLQTQFSPRFVRNDWQYKWKNWRELRQSPIHTDLNTVAPLTINVVAVEAEPVTLKIVGQTSTAARIEEEIVVDAVTKSTVNSFGPALFSIVCFDTRTHNIIITDDDGIEVAVLYNDADKTSYKLVDVSEFKWASDVDSTRTTIEVLYKHPYVKMVNDADEFVVDGCDNAIYFSAMALWASTQDGKKELVSSFMQQAMIEPAVAKDNREQHQEKKLNFGRNPFYGTIRNMHYGQPALNRPRY